MDNMTSYIIKKYPIFNLVDPELIKNIKLACVFGNDHNALFITKNDEVYGIGQNQYGELATYPTGCVFNPVLISPLCNLKIKQFVCGIYHVNALCENGFLYNWGKMDEGQLGQRDTDYSSYPQLFTPLTNEKVEQIACGYYHNVVLCKSGKVFHWGTYHSVPKQSVNGNFRQILNDKKIIDIACGRCIGFALTCDREVYAWGNNENGEINPNDRSPNIAEPTKIIIPEPVKKVVSGKSYSLAVTENGLLYGFGRLSQEILNARPMLLKTEPEFGSAVTEIKFINIAAVLTSNVLAAIDENLNIYVLGYDYGMNLRDLRVTKFSSFHEVFATLAVPSATYKNIYLDEINLNSITESLNEYFDDKETSDFSIIVENRVIHVHKCILKIRSEYFRSMFRDGWKENIENDLKIEDRTYSTYKALLKYYYTNQLDVAYENVFELLELSREHCENGLTKLCERFIKTNLNPNNASSAFHHAKYLKFQELQDFCMKFILNNFTAVALSSDFYQDSAIMAEIVKKAASRKPKLFNS